MNNKVIGNGGAIAMLVVAFGIFISSYFDKNETTGGTLEQNTEINQIGARRKIKKIKK